MDTYVNIIGGACRFADRSINTQICDNIYPIDLPEGSKTPRALVLSEGYNLWRLIDTNEPVKIIRGRHYSSTGVGGNQTLYIATYSNVWRITQSNILYNGTFQCGEISAGTSKVKFADNGFDLLVVDGSVAYKCSLTASDLTVSSTWSSVALPILNGSAIKPSNAVFSKQRFVIDSGENQFFYSDLASTTFPQLNFFSAESSADKIRAMDIVGDAIIILGDTSKEAWTFEGNPLQKIDGSINDIGIMAYDSLAIIKDSAIWLASSSSGRFTIMRSNGVSAPERISDSAIEQEISNLSQPAGARALAYYNLGQAFYVLNFVADKKTFVFNLTTGKWHTLSNTEANTGTRLAWQPSCVVSAYNGKLIAGSGDSTELFELSADIFTYGTQPILRRWETPILWDNLDTIQVKSVALDISLGTTQTLEESNGEGNVDPVVMARFSKDNAHSFSQQENRRLGKIGEYDAQLPEWLNLGVVGSLVAQFMISANCRFSIKGLKLKYSKVLHG
jgi:hypothetical protein